MPIGEDPGERPRTRGAGEGGRSVGMSSHPMEVLTLYFFVCDTIHGVAYRHPANHSLAVLHGAGVRRMVYIQFSFHARA